MTLIGHDGAWAQWRDAMGGQRMHHAWMLTGKKGVGKMHFARAAALELVGAMPGAEAGASHPDIIILERAPKDDKEEKKRAEGKAYETKRNISVDQIRQMQKRLTTRPTMGSKRVIILDPADDLEKGASNALLKSLEEPPEGTYFLLIAHRPARLLPTIRSRCRILRFPVVSDEDLGRLLSAQVPDADKATCDAAILAASGSPGIALDFVERDLGKLFGLMHQIVKQGDRDFSLRGKMAEAIGNRPDRERLLATLDLARAVLARQMETLGEGDDPRPIVIAHAQLVELTGQAPTHNFDPGLLVAEIGTLLASAAASREQANV